MFDFIGKRGSKMKNELNLSSTAINRLLDCIEDGVFLIDNTGKIVCLNEASASLTDVPKEEMLNRNIFELVERGIFDEDETVSIKTLKTGQKTHQIQQGRKGKYDILSTATPYKEDNQIKYVIVTERDVTNITNLQKQLDTESSRVEKYEAELEHYRRQNYEDSDIIFKSNRMQKLVSTAIHVASNDATVLIQGESGTGKEVIANLIQKNSHRKNQPFIKINCATIPENLIESELFGYEKGSFTGALNKGKIGFFELADKGTLFLDEIDTIPIHMQSKLLRVLQDNEFFRVGGNKQIHVDVRIIAATNSNLQVLIDEGRFRKDLYYRLNVVPLFMPLLKDRTEDILPLVNHFLTLFNEKYGTHKQISNEGITLLTRYSWPGNVRELENFIERMVVSHTEDLIDEEIILAELEITGRALPSLKQVDNQTLKEMTEAFERDIILDQMKRYPNSLELASALGIDKTTLNRKIKRYEIPVCYIK